MTARRASAGLSIRSAWSIWRGGGLAMGWRRIALVLGSAVAVFALVLVAGLVHMHGREHERVAARSLRYVDRDSPEAELAPLRVLFGTDTHLDRQWEVLWVDPRPGADPPPGLDRWPEPGTFAVSPGLARAARSDPALEARYRPSLVIGDEGVADRGEWFAYARPADGRTLGGSSEAFAGFGGASGEDGSTRSASLTVALGTGLAVAIPALLALLSGLASASPERDRRAVLLHWIGVPRPHLRTVGAIEASIGVVPGAMAGSIAGLLVAGRIERIPFTDVRPVPGDLVAPWWIVGAIGVSIVVLAAVWSAVQAGRRIDQTGPRPTVQSRRRWARVVPAAVGGVLLVIAMFGGSGGTAKPSAAATLLLMVGVPVALPIVAAKGGGWIAGGSGVAGLLAGRRIEADPVGAVRPVLGLACLVFLVLTAVGFVSANRSNDPLPARDPQLETAVVLYDVAQPADLDALEAALPQDLVAPFDHEHLVLGVDCHALGTVIVGPCDPAGMLTSVAQARIGRLLSVDPVRYDEIRLGKVAAADGAGAWAVVIGEQRTALSTRVEVAAGQHLVAPQVSTIDNQQTRTSPLWGWILLGIASGAALLTVAVILSMVDGAVRSASSHDLLVRLGSNSAQVARLEVAQFATVYAVTVGLSMVFGAANAWIMIRTAPTAAIPVPAFAFLTVSVAVVGLVGATVVWLSCGGCRRRPRRAAVARND